MKKPVFVEGQIYHIYNRGVEKRDVFMDDDDRFRFIHSLFYFNNSDNVRNLSQQKISEVEPHLSKKPRKILVEILAFVLMPNHFHLVVRQKEPGGIVKFMQKLGTGYTMSFNKKNDNRVGALFQGRFKAVLVEKDAHFMYLLHYVHLNPLEIKNKLGSTSLIERLKFLEEYRWSSLPDYLGKKNFPSITQRDFFLDFFGGSKKYSEDIKEFIQSGKYILPEDDKLGSTSLIF